MQKLTCHTHGLSIMKSSLRRCCGISNSLVAGRMPDLKVCSADVPEP
jgi:hypothetical protein